MIKLINITVAIQVVAEHVYGENNIENYAKYTQLMNLIDWYICCTYKYKFAWRLNI